MDKADLKNFTLDELTTFLKSLGQPSFRAKQLFSWLYRPGIENFSGMTDLSKEFRADLAEQCRISTFKEFKKESSEDGTIKYGFKLEDGKIIESVLIPDEERNTLCLSSQVGCAMGCRFCLTATMGFGRNLTADEMVNQVCAVQEDLQPTQKTVNNLVFMGMGEPLANFDNLIKAIDILTDQRGLDFSARRITVSTCGLIPRIAELGAKTKVNLAISLHAADSEKRSRIMPVNKAYPLEDLLAALKTFPLPRRRRIMIEYILIQGINDTDEDAKLLAKKLHGIPCKINLLPYNETNTLRYKPSSVERVQAFQKILCDTGYTTLLRTSRGSDISAACGQLANKG